MRLRDILAGTGEGREPGTNGHRAFLAYARVSTDDQERAGLSIPGQIREMHAYAQARGITIVEVYQEAESAFADDSRRPVF